MLNKFELIFTLAQIDNTVVFNIVCIQMLNKYIPKMDGFVFCLLSPSGILN